MSNDITPTTLPLTTLYRRGELETVDLSEALGVSGPWAGDTEMGEAGFELWFEWTGPLEQIPRSLPAQWLPAQPERLAHYRVWCWSGNKANTAAPCAVVLHLSLGEYDDAPQQNLIFPTMLDWIHFIREYDAVLELTASVRHFEEYQEQERQKLRKRGKGGEPL